MPDHVEHAIGLHARARSTAKKTRSGVAGLSSVTRPPSPNAAMASRIASRTEIASISGGSPTALLPKTTPGSAARSRKSTSKIVRHFGPRRQLVSGRAGGGQAALRVPEQFFQRQPAEALHEAAFDLPAIDQRRNANRRRLPEYRSRSRRCSPVKPSTSTSDTAAP